MASNDWLQDVVKKSLEKEPALLDKFFSPFYNKEGSSGQCRVCSHYAPSLSQFKMIYWHDETCAVRGALTGAGVGTLESELKGKRLFLNED
jgi:hypothetical protein